MDPWLLTVVGLSTMYLTGCTADPVRNFSCFTYDYEEYVLCSWDLERKSDAKIDVKVHLHSIYTSRKVGEINCTERTEISCKMNIGILDPDNQYLIICLNASKCHRVNYTKLESSQMPLVYTFGGDIFVLQDRGEQSYTKLYYGRRGHPSPVLRVGSRRIGNWTVYVSLIINLGLTVKNKTSFVWLDLTRDQHYREKMTSIEQTTLCNLIPHAEYDISVSVKPNDSGFWSDEVHIKSQTLPDVPYSPPMTCRNCFRILHEGMYRRIRIFWKDLPTYKWNDEYLRYCVRTDEISTRPETSKSNKTNCHETANRYSYVTEIQPTDSLRAKLWSVNSRGTSPGYSEIDIPESSELLPAPKAVGRIDYVQSQINITWETSPFDDDDHVIYTVFWCKRGMALSCLENVRWQEVSGRNWMAVDIADTSSTYMFAVAKERNGSTTGIVWTSCITNMTEFHSTPRTNVQHDGQAVHISWHLPDCSLKLLQTHITGFIIYYCFSKDCNVLNTTLVDSSTTYVTIHMAEEGVDVICASVAVALEGKIGSKSTERCAYNIIKDEERNSNWMDMFTIIPIIGAVVIGCSLVIVLAFWRWRKSSDYKMEIIVPEINSSSPIMSIPKTDKITDESMSSTEDERRPMLQSKTRIKTRHKSQTYTIKSGNASLRASLQGRGSISSRRPSSDGVVVDQSEQLPQVAGETRENSNSNSYEFSESVRIASSSNNCSADDHDGKNSSFDCGNKNGTADCGNTSDSVESYVTATTQDPMVTTNMFPTENTASADGRQDSKMTMNEVCSDPEYVGEDLMRNICVVVPVKD